MSLQQSECDGNEFKLIYITKHDEWFVIKHLSSGLILTFDAIGNLSLRPLTTDVELTNDSDK